MLPFAYVPCEIVIHRHQVPWRSISTKKKACCRGISAAMGEMHEVTLSATI